MLKKIILIFNLPLNLINFFKLTEFDKILNRERQRVVGVDERFVTEAIGYSLFCF